MGSPCKSCQNNDICHNNKKCNKYKAYQEKQRLLMQKKRAENLLAVHRAIEDGETIDAEYTEIGSAEEKEKELEELHSDIEEAGENFRNAENLPREEIISSRRSLAQQKRFVDAINNIPKGTNIELTRFIAKVTQFPKIDYLQDADAIYKRLDEYLLLCAEMDHQATVGTFALALGITRQRLNQLKNGKRASIQTKEAREAINYCLSVLNAYLEQSITENKIGAIPGIFFSKVHFGYNENEGKDELEEAEAEKEKKTAEEIRKQYEDLELEEQEIDNETYV